MKFYFAAYETAKLEYDSTWFMFVFSLQHASFQLFATNTETKVYL